MHEFDAMVSHMRTTMTIDDDLYRQTKEAAARTGRSVGSVVEEALRAALARHQDAPTVPTSLPTSPGGLRPGIDLDDSAALLDVMEGR